MTYWGGNISTGFCAYEFGCGVVFKITPAGTESVLYTFTRGSDGATPVGGLIADASGNLYGATTQGGVGHGGTVFELSGTGFIPASSVFVGIPGKPNCQGVSISTLPQTYGGLAHRGSQLEVQQCGGNAKHGHQILRTVDPAQMRSAPPLDQAVRFVSFQSIELTCFRTEFPQ